MGALAILARLDAVVAELLELRAEVAAEMPDVGHFQPLQTGNGLDADDLSPEHLLDTHAAQERFGYPQDTIRKWCRTEGLGVMRGGRWLVSVPRLQRRINGK